MMAGRRLVAIGLLAIVGLSPALGQEQVAIENLGIPDANLTAKIAELAIPQTIVVPKGGRLFDAIVDRCGNNLAYLTLVKSAAVPQGETAPADLYAAAERQLTFSLPACIAPGAPGTVSAEAGDSVSMLADRYDIPFTLDPGSSLNITANHDATIVSAIAKAGRDVAIANAAADPAQPCTTGGRGNFSADLFCNRGAVTGYLTDPQTASILRGATANVAKELDAQLTPDLPVFGSVELDTPDLGKWLKAQQDYSAVLNANVIRFDNGLNGDYSIQAGQQYALPDLLPQQRTLTLKPGFHAADIETALVASVPVAAAAPPPTLVPVPRQLHNISDDLCGAPNGKPAFDAPAVVAQLGLNRMVRPSQNSRPRVGKIMVLDNGFPDNIDPALLNQIWPVDERNPTDLKKSNSAYSSGSALGGTINGFKLNAATQSESAGVPDDYGSDDAVVPSDRWHGLGVTMVALGGADFAPYRQVVDIPMQVVFMGILDESGLQLEAVQRAAVAASDAQIHIINASFTFPTENTAWTGIRSVLARAKILLVVAAGNDGQSLDSTTDFPAILGGAPKPSDPDKPSPNVITVGMSRVDGKPHPKSAHSVNNVDLFAPGCRVSSYAMDKPGPEGKLIRANWTGTSFAAPLVSFTAALLDQAGFDAASIKSRLIYSADYDPDLSGSALSSGRLNIERAIAWPFNQYVLKDGTLIRDTADVPGAQTFTLCGREKSLFQVAKLAIRDGRAYMRTFPNDPSSNTISQPEECALKPGDTMDLTVTDFVSGLQSHIALDTLSDYIARRPDP